MCEVNTGVVRVLASHNFHYRECWVILIPPVPSLSALHFIPLRDFHLHVTWSTANDVKRNLRYENQ